MCVGIIIIILLVRGQRMSNVVLRTGYAATPHNRTIRIDSFIHSESRVDCYDWCELGRFLNCETLHLRTEINTTRPSIMLWKAKESWMAFKIFFPRNHTRTGRTALALSPLVYRIFQNIHTKIQCFGWNNSPTGQPHIVGNINRAPTPS